MIELLRRNPMLLKVKAKRKVDHDPNESRHESPSPFSQPRYLDSVLDQTLKTTLGYVRLIISNKAGSLACSAAGSSARPTKIVSTPAERHP